MPPRTAPETTPSSPPIAVATVASDPLLPQESRAPELIVTIRRSGDQKADVERLRMLYDLLTEFEGVSTFKFHLLGNHDTDGNLELVFPNHRTRCCPELERELVAMVGPDCYYWR